MTWILDTDVCVSLLRGAPAVVNRIASLMPDDCGISTITLFELYAGVEKARMPLQEQAKVLRLLEITDLLPFDAAAAIKAAHIRENLERMGKPIGPYDLLIAGHALALNLILATGNVAEFQRVPHLRVERWI